MRAKPILSTVVLLAAAYTAYPYVALYRLQEAIWSGDPGRISALVDWDQVREGLKDDIAQQLVEDPPEQQPKATTQDAVASLPPFGASFVKGIASKAVDSDVTPDAVARLMRPGAQAESAEADPLKAVSFKDAKVTWAFFDSPESFTLWLQTPAAGAKPLKLRMELHEGAWRITRVWLPTEFLRHPG